jgi:outer membrane protein OmpA-like peptidoglycan-associated protein
VSACGPQRVRRPERSGPDLVVLLPDPETDATGKATVSNPSGQVHLMAARDMTLVTANGRPANVTVMSESEITRLFGDVLATLPPAPQHFTLNFRFESDELTEESRALVPEILDAVKKRPIPEVAVVGHTDTTGTPATNFELGLKRANMVRALLIQAGLEQSFIEVTSHGEAELLVHTKDDVLEPRNRRVEITIR